MGLSGLKLGKSLADRDELVAIGLVEPVSPLQDAHPENVGDKSAKQASSCACQLKVKNHSLMH